MAEFDPRAAAEMAEAAEHYDAERLGLGATFLDEIEKLIATLHEQPALGVARRATRARQIPLRTFPFLLVYTIEPVRIVAVAHAKRRPGYWRQRLRRT